MGLVDFLPLFVVGFAGSIGLTPITRRMASRFGVVDKPSARKVHSTPIPLLGGLAIYGAFLLSLLIFGNPPQYILELTAILACATWLAFIGLLDDRLDLSPLIRFPAQILTALVMIAVGIRVDLFGNVILDGAITVFWIVGLINSINFLDNMDGLAAGISATCAGFLFVLAVSQGQELVGRLAAALCGSAVGFLIYNFNPATTFMGDTGSTVLGFLLAIIGIKLRFPQQSLSVTWIIPVMVLGLPIFDTTLVVFTRLREGRSPLQGGKDHTSHRLVIMGLSHRMAVVTLYAICGLLGIAAVYVSRAEPRLAQPVEIIIVIASVIFFVVLEVTRIRHQRRVALEQKQLQQQSTS
jgi:UDP-GlcNAc:undecaprenyl-phosphate/decaprenyl-phosphate GlcNAc-1-phosphate transferase